MASDERKTLLAVTLSNIGDVILTTPVLTNLRARFPHSRLTVVVGPKAEGLLKGSQLIDRLLVYDKWAGWRHKLALVRALREETYDYVVDLRNSALPFLVRAIHRSSVFRTFRSRSARGQHLEILERMHLLENGKEAPPPRFDFFSAEEEASLSEKLRRKGFDLSSPWMVVAPGAGSEAKRWYIEGFCQTLDRLLITSSHFVAAVGDTNEKLLGAKLAEINPRRIVNLAGEITLRELAALVARSSLVLTNDSAVMHLGYELNRPVVALFGPTDPERYGREGKIWRIVREPSLAEIASEKVVEVCSKLLHPISSP